MAKTEKKKTPAQFVTIQKIGDYLNADPEVVDFYLYRFYCTWGKNALRALVRFVIWAEENDSHDIIASTLTHDFTLENKNCARPRTSNY